MCGRTGYPAVDSAVDLAVDLAVARAQDPAVNRAVDPSWKSAWAALEASSNRSEGQRHSSLAICKFGSYNLVLVEKFSHALNHRDIAHSYY